jgi:hypothetical protein
VPNDHAPGTQSTARKRDAGAYRGRRLRVAGEICVLYHEAVRAEVAALTRGGRVRAAPSRTIDDVEPSDREWFLKAATICIEERADARDFVVAQFARWRAASAYLGKFLLPQPYHLGKLGARVRLLQHRAAEEVRRSRAVTLDEQPREQRFYVEERQLKGIARVSRRDPADVLADQPERFSREFLEHKGAWVAVADLWQERRA